MRIDPFVRDLSRFRSDLAVALETSSTRLYLDTSTLMWMARLSRAARGEFMAWCGARNTVVPVWAAHEFQRHLLSGTIRSNMAKVVSETASKQREFAQIATEQVDDALCLSKGYGQRSTYISEVQRLMASFHQLGQVLDVDDDRLKQAADEVVDFINGRTLGTDLDSIIKELSATGDFRLEHRVPPGFKDAYKGENALGDAVMWREILQDVELVTQGSVKLGRWPRWMRRVTPVTGVLISRDEKSDWLSTSFVRKQDGEVVKPSRELELDVALPHPLLCHEFERRGGASLFLVHPAALSGVVEAMQQEKGSPPTIASWRAASLRPDVLEKLLAHAAQAEKRLQSMKAKASKPSATPSGAVPAAVTPAAAQPPGPPKSNLTEVLPLDVMKGSIAKEVKEFVHADADARGSLLEQWQLSVASGAMAPTRFGRILGAVAGEARGLELAQLPALLETVHRMLPELGAHVLLGAHCAAFFDNSGQALQLPRVALAGLLLDLEGATWSDIAFAALRQMLKAVGVTLPYEPGSKQKVKVVANVSASTKSQPAVLQDLRLGGQSVLVDGLSANHPRRLSVLLGDAQLHQCKGPLLQGLIAREYLIPLDRLEQMELSDGKPISWRPDAGLLPLDTSAPKGIGEFNDEDFE